MLERAVRGRKHSPMTRLRNSRWRTKLSYLSTNYLISSCQILFTSKCNAGQSINHRAELAVSRPYIYQPLQAQDAIRMVELLPGGPGEPIRVSLHHQTLLTCRTARPSHMSGVPLSENTPYSAMVEFWKSLPICCFSWKGPEPLIQVSFYGSMLSVSLSINRDANTPETWDLNLCFLRHFYL